MRDRGHLEDTLAHEMVHAYDHLRFKLDWSGADLRHAACSEVRFLMQGSMDRRCQDGRRSFGMDGLTTSRSELAP
jgi:mitochondrial inner membrane protease ATP23